MSGGLFLKLAFAALVSGGAAGLVATLAAFFTSHAFGYAQDWWTAEALLGWLPIGFFTGLVVASLPAFFAGAGLWSLGGSLAAARHPLAWAAAGAVVGGASWVLFALVLGSIGENGLHPEETVFLAAGIVAGTGGALVFLAAMRLTGAPSHRPR